MTDDHRTMNGLTNDRESLIMTKAIPSSLFGIELHRQIGKLKNKIKTSYSLEPSGSDISPKSVLERIFRLHGPIALYVPFFKISEFIWNIVPMGKQ